MSFLRYLKDKSFFVGFYVCLMLVVTLTVVVSRESGDIAGNILYIHLLGFFMAAAYIVIGYIYRMKFYRGIRDLIESRHEEIVAAMPKPANYEQRLYVELLKKMHAGYAGQLQSLYNDKSDHLDFITSWIHEVKVPIAASRLLIENSEAVGSERLADKFENEVDKIDHYVEQALYYTRIDSFSKDYLIAETRLDSLIKKSVKKYAKTFIEKRIRFRMEDMDPGQTVHSDSKWLGFIMDQILFNSLKYTDEGGEITVRFEEDHAEKRLLIQDNGIGIGPEDIHRVFDKGFTGSTGRKHAKSTGMGLYLSKQMAGKLNHDLSVQSEAGIYTTVTIHFPKFRNYFL